MAIQFSQHALYQLKERKISLKEVKDAVRDPDKIMRQSAKRMRAVKRRDEKYLLVVIYDMFPSQTKVVTAFITSKIQKYL